MEDLSQEFGIFDTKPRGGTEKQNGNCVKSRLVRVSLLSYGREKQTSHELSESTLPVSGKIFKGGGFDILRSFVLSSEWKLVYRREVYCYLFLHGNLMKMADNWIVYGVYYKSF